MRISDWSSDVCSSDLTLREWGVRLDEALFLGGRAKGPFLDVFGADIFFDDSLHNIDSARQHVATGHAPHGVSNPWQGCGFCGNGSSRSCKRTPVTDFLRAAAAGCPTASSPARAGSSRTPPEIGRAHV